MDTLNSPKAEITSPTADQQGWSSRIQEIADQPRMRRGYTERVVRLSPPQIAMIEEEATFRHVSSNKMIQVALRYTLGQRASLLLNTLLAEPSALVDSRDLDALVMGWLEGQISKNRAQAQATVQPEDRKKVWAQVARLEEISTFYQNHPAFSDD